MSQDSMPYEVQLILFSGIITYLECGILLWSIDWIDSFINGDIIDEVTTNDSPVDTVKVTAATTIDATANKTVFSQVLSFISFLLKVLAVLLWTRATLKFVVYCPCYFVVYCSQCYFLLFLVWVIIEGF
jgi:hypothetical protein